MNALLANASDTAAAGFSPKPFLPEEPAKISTALVGSAVTIGGEIFSQQDLFVDGEVNGTMTLPNHKLTIGPQARVKATIKAQNVVIVGSVEGKIEASERIELRSHSQFIGDVRGPRIVIENGAFIKGNIEVTR